MSRRRGRRARRYDENQKLNIKKVLATVIAIVVFVMIIISFKGIFSSNEKEVKTYFPIEYKTIFEDSKWGVIDTTGKKVLESEYEEMIIIPDESKDIFICTYNIDYNNETYKTKVLDKNGKALYNSYTNLTPLENTDGLKIWYEKNALKFPKNNKYGLINFEGKEVLKAEYDRIYALEGISNCLVIEKDGNKGIYNTITEDITIEPKYKEILGIKENYENGFRVKNENDKFGIIAADKSQVLEFKYDEIKDITDKTYYVVVENGTLQIVDQKGKVILNSGFNDVKEVGVEGFIIEKDGKYGLIDQTGKTIINTEYDNLKFAITNHYIAQKNQKVGIINNSLQEVVGFEYTAINYVKEADFFKADKENYKTDILDRNFNKILEDVIIAELNIEEGFIRVRKEDNYKYYNFKFEEKNSKEVLSKNSLFLIKENGKYGYENKAGERIVDCIYDDAKEQNKFGYCAINKDGKWGALKADGTVVLEPSVDMNEYLYIDFISEWYRNSDLKLNFYIK